MFEVLLPHFLTVYERNLEIAYSGVTASVGLEQVSFCKDIITAVVDKAKVSGSSSVSDCVSAVGTTRSFGNISGDLKLSGAFEVLQVVNLVGHAGTWYGLYCANRKLDSVVGSLSTVSNELQQGLQSLSLKMETLTKVVCAEQHAQSLQAETKKLKAVIKTISDKVCMYPRLVDEQNKRVVREESLHHMVVLHDKVNYLLQELDEDLLNTAPGGIEKHAPVPAAAVAQPILAAVVLDVVCWALLFEIQVY